jgi:hypothetical protein
MRLRGCSRDDLGWSVEGLPRDAADRGREKINHTAGPKAGEGSRHRKKPR